MKMAKSSTKKDKLPEEVSRHLHLFTDYIKYWTDRELERLSSIETVPICVPTNNGYRIGSYKLQVLNNKTCEVYNLNRELIHVFDNKLSAILHTVYTIKKNYKLADELLFGRLAHGGSVVVDIDDEGKVLLDIQSSNTPPSKANNAGVSGVEPVEEI